MGTYTQRQTVVGDSLNDRVKIDCRDRQILLVHSQNGLPKTHRSDRSHRLGPNGEESYIADHQSCPHWLSMSDDQPS